MAKRKLTKLHKGKLPASPSGVSQNLNYASLAEETFGASGYCGKSLLRSIAGAVRCKAPQANSLLFSIVKERQGVYAALLGRLMSGSSLTGAAAAVGLQRETVRSWMVQGLNDLSSDLDTYYSRFATDCQAAFAHSVSEAEIAIQRRNPLEYLRTGPGRAFYQGREEYWQLPQPNAPQPENDINPLAEIGQSDQQAAIANDAEFNSRRAQAVEELKKLGILQNPQMVQQLEQSLQTTHQVNNDSPVIIDAPSAQLDSSVHDATRSS